MINTISHIYKIDMADAEIPEKSSYACFNDFFTRAMRSETRPIDIAADSIASPADGTVSQAGIINGGELIQAKDITYSVTELLANQELGERFDGGLFSTIYLSPRDYHRVHCPLSGTLTEMIHIPGRLFSVSPGTTKTVTKLFARNERVVALFDTAAGPMAVVMVGAIFVASIETVWHGVVTPPQGKQIQRRRYGPNEHRFDKGDELGRFNMGSTVIILLAKDRASWNKAHQPGAAVRMGQQIGLTLGLA